MHWRHGSDHAGIPAVTIREARPTDVSAISDLLGELGYPQAGQAATADRIRAWAEDPSRAAYVAEEGNDLLGLVAVHICPFFERDGSWGRIVALVVSEPARGRGVGSQLVAAAESFTGTRGCLRMEVTSSDRRHGAHDFYRRHGYVDQAGRSRRFLRELPDSSRDAG